MWTWTPSRNKARGVTYVDRLTRQVKEVRGKAVILCAHGLGIDADFAELLDARVPQWAGELERRTGTLFDGPCRLEAEPRAVCQT